MNHVFSLSRTRPSSGAQFRRVATSIGWTIASAALVLGALELVTRARILPEEYFPPISEVLANLGPLLHQPNIGSAVADTLIGWAIGLAVALGVGLPMGILIGLSRLMQLALRVPMEFLRPVPPVVFLPLVVLVYGPTMTMTVLLVFLGAIWPIVYQTSYGVREVDPVLRDTVRVFKIDARRRVLQVTLPAALPLIVVGVRISAAIALIVVIVAGLVGGAPGLGQQLLLAQSSGAYVDLYGLVIVTGVIGVIIDGMLRKVERSLLGWHPSQRLDVA